MYYVLYQNTGIIAFTETDKIHSYIYFNESTVDIESVINIISLVKYISIDVYDGSSLQFLRELIAHMPKHIKTLTIHDKHKMCPDMSFPKDLTVYMDYMQYHLYRMKDNRQ